MRKLVVMIVVVGVLIVPAISSALEARQKLNLQLGWAFGSRVEWRGDVYPRTIQSIIFQESHAGSSDFIKDGVIIGDLDRHGKPKSLGIPQMQVPTARFVGSKFPVVFTSKFGTMEPTDEEIIIALLTDSVWSIWMCASYFDWLLDEMGSYKAAILAYNMGPTGAREFIARYGDAGKSKYVRSVLEYRRGIINTFNEESNNG